MLLIATDHLRTLVTEAERRYPDEACALLLGASGPGDRRDVVRVELSPNIAADRRQRFEIDPGLRIGLERELRDQRAQGRDINIVGVWHSHPDGPAAPSATDAAMVHEPHLAWLITAVSTGEAVQTTAWLPLDYVRGPNGFREIPLRLAERN